MDDLTITNSFTINDAEVYTPGGHINIPYAQSMAKVNTLSYHSSYFWGNYAYWQNEHEQQEQITPKPAAVLHVLAT